MSTKIGVVLEETPRAWKVRCETFKRTPVTVFLPKSLAEITKEGVPTRRMAWAPSWWCEKEGIAEYRDHAVNPTLPS